MKRLIAAAAAMVAVLAPRLGSADGNTGIVYGRVLLSTTHQPVCPISVRVVSNREAPWETHTQADGSFIFLQVRPGPVEILIGRNREIRRVTISANLEEQQTFYLHPLPRMRATRSSCGSTAYGGYAFTDYDPYNSWVR